MRVSGKLDVYLIKLSPCSSLLWRGLSSTPQLYIELYTRSYTIRARARVLLHRLVQMRIRLKGFLPVIVGFHFSLDFSLEWWPNFDLPTKIVLVFTTVRIRKHSMQKSFNDIACPSWYTIYYRTIVRGDAWSSPTRVSSSRASTAPRSYNVCVHALDYIYNQRRYYTVLCFSTSSF